MTRLPGENLRRLAARLFSARTMDLIVDPVLADLRHEHGLAVRSGRTLRAACLRLRGPMALVRALAVHAVLSAAEPVAADHPPSAARRYGTLALCVALSFVALSCLLFQDIARSFAYVCTVPGGWPWILPSVAATALPASVLAGTAIGVLHLDRAGKSPRSARSLVPPMFFVSAAATLVTFLLFGWLAPPANQVYREKVLQAITLRPGVIPPKGDRERTLPELAHIVARLPSGQGTGARTELHKKLAIPASCLLSGLVAIPLFGRLRLRQPAVVLASVLIGWCVFWGPQKILEDWTARDALSPALDAWIGDMVLAMAASILWTVGGRRSTDTDSGIEDQSGACSAARSSR